MTDTTADLVAALELAANRFDRLTLEFDYGTQSYFDCIAWAREARALTAEVERLRGLVGEARPPISLDGPHLPDDHRVWLARQLLDSKNDDETAYGIAAYFPAVSDIWRKDKDTPHD